MDNQKQTIDDLMNAMFSYLRSIYRSEGTIRRYHQKWVRVKHFMLANNLKYYNIKVEKAYLVHELGDFDYHQLNEKERILVNVIEVLSEFQSTGRLMMGPRKHRPKVFKGKIGLVIKDFINYRENTFNLSENTIAFYTHYLYLFYSFLIRHGMKDIQQLKSADIIKYVEQIGSGGSASMHVSLLLIKRFLAYLYEQNILQIDHSFIVPKDNYKRQAKLPSTFTHGEITALLQAVDRGNAKGKRDYAILLMATKLGLRSSDIRELKFENIHWDQGLIILNQRKTGRPLALPLLPEIGNAMIDYLKHGRPVSNDDNCFISILAPYRQMDTNAIGNLVSKYIGLANINCSGRKHGPHAIRHSFASELLSEDVSMPIISAALGHKNMESTKIYLRIDAGSLKKCALEVSPVSASFYNRIGGYSHE
ncbi:MAG TPA: site-specific integrase [Mucilaginibacter sp.]|nr:site-specific integrase [Mucilaginibacter sp.]